MNKIKQETMDKINNKIINDNLTLISLDKYIVYMDSLGYKYKQAINNFLLSDKYVPLMQSNPFLIENIKIRIIVNNIKVEFLDDKILKSKEKSLWRCSCGNTFLRCRANVLNQNQIHCNNCANIANNNHSRNSHDFIIDFFEKKGFTVLNIENYRSKDSELILKDNQGYIYKSSYASLLQNKKSINNVFSGSNKFHKSNPYTLKNIENYLNINNIDLKLLENNKYVGCDEILSLQCKTCGHVVKKSIHSLLANNGICYNCSVYNSQYEKQVYDFLIQLNLFFDVQKRYKDCKNKHVLPFDFCIVINENDFLIEVDGEQHFKTIDFFGGKQGLEQRQKLDKIKTQYCIKKHIPLLRLTYKDMLNNQYEEKINNFLSL